MWCFKPFSRFISTLFWGKSTFSKVFFLNWNKCSLTHTKRKREMRLIGWNLLYHQKLNYANHLFIIDLKKFTRWSFGSLCTFLYVIIFFFPFAVLAWHSLQLKQMFGSFPPDTGELWQVCLWFMCGEWWIASPWRILCFSLQRPYLLMTDKSLMPQEAVTLTEVQRCSFSDFLDFLKSVDTWGAGMDFSPDLLFLSGFVSLDGGAIFAPAYLRGRVGFNLNSQLHVLQEFGWNVLIQGSFHIHEASLCGKMMVSSAKLCTLYTAFLQNNQVPQNKIRINAFKSTMLVV